MTAAPHTPNTSVDMDILLRISRQKQARVVHRRPDEAAPARTAEYSPSLKGARR